VETTELDPKDIEIVKQELGFDGYYRWLIIKKHEEKAILKAQLHNVSNEKDKLSYKVILLFNPDDSFKETCLVGEFYEGKGSFIVSI